MVGTGSIGRRHIANLLKLGVNVFAYSYRNLNNADLPFGNKITLVNDWLNKLRDVDAVIIANSTELHLQVALAAAKLKKAIFIEKPLSNSLNKIKKIESLLRKNKIVLESGFNLRTHPNLIWIKKNIDKGTCGEIMYFKASVGQRLSDWRPKSDYRKSYSAFREKGGGVILDLIHELDLISWLGGKVVEVVSMTRHIPLLEIQTEAIAQILLRLDSGILAQIHLDYIRPMYSRTLEVVGNKQVLSWNYLQGKVTSEKTKYRENIAHRVSKSFNRNWMFLTHMKYFLHRIITPDTPALSSFSDGVSALRIAMACHKSFKEKRIIKLP